MCVESSVESSTVGRQRGRGAGGMRFSVPLGYKYSRESLERKKMKKMSNIRKSVTYAKNVMHYIFGNVHHRGLQ